MTRAPTIPLLEDFGFAVMSADAASPSSVQSAITMLRELRALPCAVAASELIDACQAKLQSIFEGRSKDAQADLDAVCALSADLQLAMEKANAALTDEERGAAPLYDAALVREFADGARLSLDDAEAEILEAEKGNTEALSMLKRRIHTLKGESGVLGMDGLTRVCHAAEDTMVRPTSAEWADRLLKACDWIRHAALSMAAGDPEPSPAEILDILAAPPPPFDPSVSPPALSAAAVDPAPQAAPHIEVAPPPVVLDPLDDLPMFSAVPEDIEPATSTQPDPFLEDSELPSAGVESQRADLGTVQRDEETIVLFGEFLHESEDGLSRADQVLMSIERDGVDAETVNGLFRIFHTIKGVAGVLELKEVTSLAHATESMLNRVREGKLELRGAVVDLVFDATEMMGAMMRDVRRAIERGTDVASVAGLAALLDRLEAVLQGRVVPEVLPHPPMGAKLGEILSMAPLSIPPKDVENALQAQKSTGRMLGEELVARGAASPKQVAQALRAQNATDPSASQQSNKLQDTIKVDLARVDSLVEMIGELVIVETMVAHAPEVTSLTSPRIQTYLSQLSKITRDLQDVGMRMRMVPVRAVFQKMARMARDLGKKGSKQVRLETAGEGTEMDRSMVEQVADPLVHMIRNSVDHGLEGPADRQKAGKPLVGTVKLSAYHEGGSIVIEIADDGRGLDREAILRKAKANGLIGENDKLTDAEVYNLIFAPGFSTAAQVTEISGRGVGMDVVKRNVDKMRGRVLISTKPGEGTVFKIVLPLTLAIIDGMLVRCGDERYIIPTLSIIESIQPDSTMLMSFASRGELVNVRGDILPLLRLDRLFKIHGAQNDPTRGLVVVVESLGRKLGLLVDEVVTQQQVVIKSLGTGLSNIRFVSGAAILSDGRVGLILNMEEIGALVGFDAVGRSRERASSQEVSPQVNAP